MVMQVKFALAAAASFGLAGGAYGAFAGALLVAGISKHYAILSFLSRDPNLLDSTNIELTSNIVMQMALDGAVVGTATGLAAYGIFSGSRYLYNRVTILDEDQGNENDRSSGMSS